MSSALGNYKNDYICIEDNSRYSVALHADVFLCMCGCHCNGTHVFKHRKYISIPYNSLHMITKGSLVLKYTTSYCNGEESKALCSPTPLKA